MKRIRNYLMSGIVCCLTAVIASTMVLKTAISSEIPPEQQERLKIMKADGTGASMTVFPVRLGGKPFDRVGEVVGLLLERQGLAQVTLGNAAFDAGDGTGMAQMMEAFGAFVRNNPIGTEYALYAEFNGDAKSGIDELRAVVVDAKGALVWSDELTEQNKEITSMKTKEPMTFAVLLVDRLSPSLNLSAATAKAAKPGAMARAMEERSGLPPQEERNALAGREKELKKRRGKATLTVFPALAGGKTMDMASAAAICKAVNDAGLFTATPSAETLSLAIEQNNPNEPKRLWDMARGLREQVKKNPVKTDYAVFIDYAYNPANWEQGMVHYAVCDSAGEWVIVDMLNSYNPEYRKIKPDSDDDCIRLFAKSLESHVK